MILKDPKVLSVLPLKKRGEKGWRELQGNSLRELLLELIRKEVVTIWNVVWKEKIKGKCHLTESFYLVC